MAVVAVHGVMKHLESRGQLRWCARRLPSATGPALYPTLFLPDSMMWRCHHLGGQDLIADYVVEGSDMDWSIVRCGSAVAMRRSAQAARRMRRHGRVLIDRALDRIANIAEVDDELRSSRPRHGSASASITVAG